MQGVLASEVARFRAVVIGTLPHFAGRPFTTLHAGWDSVALECDGWIFKFPRGPTAEGKLRREVALLGQLRLRVTMPLPQMAFYEGTYAFSQHRKIPGASLETAEYELLDNGRRNALAARMAQLYADLHALPLQRMHELGAVSADPWLAPEEIIEKAAPLLPKDLRRFLERTVTAYVDLEFDADEVIFGYFDGHGWNMAFDHETGTLNGVFDFADAGFGPRHRDLSYSNWISPDLTLRIIAAYERRTGRTIDRDRVMLYTSTLRLVELAEGGIDTDLALANIVEWQNYFGS